MKHIFLQCTLLLFVLQQSYSQVVTTDSYFPNGNKEITLIFDLKQTKDVRAAGFMGKTSDVFLWSGAGTADNAFEYQPTGQKNFSVPFEMGRMTSLGNDRWSIKLKPRDYYKVPIGRTIKKLGLLLKTGDGKTQTEDFILDLFDDGLYFKIIEPDLTQVFEENQAISITLITSYIVDKIKFENKVFLKEFNATNSAIISVNVSQISLTLTIINNNQTITEEIRFNIKPKNTILNQPPNIKDGINYINDNTVSFSFFAPKKSFVYLIGDFNDWKIDIKYLMNKTPNGEHYWLNINNLEKGKEYAFQYLIDGKIAVGDPFCEKILDPKFDS